MHWRKIKIFLYPQICSREQCEHNILSRRWTEPMAQPRGKDQSDLQTWSNTAWDPEQQIKLNSPDHEVACSRWAPRAHPQWCTWPADRRSNWRSQLRLKPLSGDDLRSKETTVSDWEDSHRSITYPSGDRTQSATPKSSLSHIPIRWADIGKRLLTNFRPAITLLKSMTVLPFTSIGNSLWLAKLSAHAWQMDKNGSLNATK